MTKNQINNELSNKDQTSKLFSNTFYVNQSVKLSCDLCSHTFNSEDALARHQRLHDKTCQYTCEKCSFRYIRKSNLKRHRRKYCSFRGLPSVSKVPSHFKLPTPEPYYNFVKETSTIEKKQYACDVCEKSFIKKDILNKHKKRHDPKRKFSCDKCALRFLSQSHLNDHNEKYCRYKVMFLYAKLLYY